MNEAILTTHNLCKRFGAVPACSHLSLTLAPGELHALIGPNGAGKTTVLNLLSGFITPDSGSIFLAGRDISAIPVHGRAALGLARSFQLISLFDRLSVEENLAIAVQARSGTSFRFLGDAAADRRLREPARRVMARMGLKGCGRVITGSLSHGQRRQLEVAMALAIKPRVLLLDEPMAGLGAGGSQRLQELISTLKGRLSILLIEHDMTAVFSLADRITVLVRGEAIAAGTPDEIRRNPEVQRVYLGEEAAAC